MNTNVCKVDLPTNTHCLRQKSWIRNEEKHKLIFWCCCLFLFLPLLLAIQLVNDDDDYQNNDLSDDTEERPQQATWPSTSTSFLSTHQLCDKWTSSDAAAFLGQSASLVMCHRCNLQTPAAGLTVFRNATMHPLSSVCAWYIFLVFNLLTCYVSCCHYSKQCTTIFSNNKRRCSTSTPQYSLSVLWCWWLCVKNPVTPFSKHLEAQPHCCQQRKNPAKRWQK